MNDDTACPNCGYCPTCGRSNAPAARHLWPFPWSNPWFTTSTTATRLETTDATSTLGYLETRAVGS